MRTRFLSLIGHDERGAALIELALAAPFMAVLLMGMADMARGYSLKLLCEQAAQRTVEDIEQEKSVSSSYDTTLSTEATNAMTDAGYSTGNTITTSSWLECGTDTTHYSFSGSCTNASDANARYVSVKISRNFVPLFTSMIWPGANSDGTITVSGYAEVRIQ